VLTYNHEQQFLHFQPNDEQQQPLAPFEVIVRHYEGLSDLVRDPRVSNYMDGALQALFAEIVTMTQHPELIESLVVLQMQYLGMLLHLLQQELPIDTEEESSIEELLSATRNRLNNLIL